MFQFYLRIFILFLVVISASFSIKPKNGEFYELKKFGKNNGNLKMFFYNPFEEANSVKRPLVIVLHGCNQSAKSVSELTGWNKISKKYKFFVLYPQQKRSNNPSLCFNWFNEKDISKNNGECGSIKEMIDFAKKKYLIDTNQIFVTGLSAGAAMSVSLLSVYPEIFKAGAIFAGGPYKSAANSLESIASMRGKVTKPQNEWAKLILDENINYTGAYPKLIIYHGTKDNVVDYKNAKNLISQWAGINNTDTIPDLTQKNFLNVDEITMYKYKDENNSTVVTFYSIKDLGHKYLNKPGELENEGGKKGLFSHELNYHSTFQTALDFGLVIK